MLVFISLIDFSYVATEHAGLVSNVLVLPVCLNYFRNLTETTVHTGRRTLACGLSVAKCPCRPVKGVCEDQETHFTGKVRTCCQRSGPVQVDSGQGQGQRQAQGVGNRGDELWP